MRTPGWFVKVNSPTGDRALTHREIAVWHRAQEVDLLMCPAHMLPWRFQQQLEDAYERNFLMLSPFRQLESQVEQELADEIEGEIMLDGWAGLVA